ncbi:hypothetical protein, variant [Aphanomyces astaci]|nr:hypothetical protein, variant [Aphanomyces astaci]ETV70690.1 hypothetical protein, variant [Aphanomyces astaci]|eukprot:XP_009839753.1 hypothetical protein, variant [Aphanomyces astaci]
MQHRIHALQEILTLQETELSHAVVSATARKQLSHVTPDPPSMYQKLLAKWRTKVFEMVVAAKCQDMASHELGQQAARSVHIMETRVADHVRHIQSLTQRLADADAAARLLHLQLDQLHADRTTLQSKCQRHVVTVESERQRMREMAHHVIASVQDNGMVQRLQHMYTRLTDHEQRLRRQVQHAETLVVCLARKEARLRNQEAAWEGERRVWIKRLQGANVADTNTSTTTGKPATTLHNLPPTKAKSSFKLKPESEHVLRAVFHRVDPYQTGLAPTKRFIAALQKDWTVRQELGAAGVDKLMAVMSHSPLFGVTKHVTWGEFVLLFLPDLSPLPKDAPVVDNVPETSDGVPVPFEEGSKVTKPALTLPLNLDEWTRDQLECHVVHLEQERARLVCRVKEDASELQHRVRGVQQQWHVKCDAQVQSMAALQDTIRDLERTLALQTNAHAHVETQLAEVRAQSATADSAWRTQVRELELKLDSVSREHDKAMARLEEAHAMALQDAALQVRQAQKDQAKQDVYIRQLERQLKRLQDSVVAQEKDELQALARQLEKRDVEITKLRRERNALLTTLREQEKAPSPIMVDQGTDLPELVVATVETSDKVTTPAIQLQTPRKPQTAAPPATRSVPPPTSLSHRMSALTSQANRWLTDDDDWAHDDV